MHWIPILLVLLFYRFRAAFSAHHPTSRTVPGSNFGSVVRRDFLDLPAEPCALGSTQSLKMSTRDFSWGKGGQCVRLTTYHTCSAECQALQLNNYKFTNKVKQACSGTEGSRKLRFPDFMTTARDGCEVVSLTHRPPLPPVNTPCTHFC